MDDFFSFISKAVIIIPIIIIIISLILKFNSPEKLIPIVILSPTPIPTQKPAQNNSFKLNLTGPITCNNLFIKDKKVFYRNNQENYLLNGDCLYQWQTGKYSGEKKCGLSSYINLAENYTGLLNVSDLAGNSTVASLVKSKGINPTEVLKSCKKGEVRDETVFKIPERVLFKMK